MSHDEEHARSQLFVVATTVLGVLSGIVAAAVWSPFLQWASSLGSRRNAPLVRHIVADLNKELATMGLFSFVLFLYSKLGVYYDRLREEAVENVELAHQFLFFFAIYHVAAVLWSVTLGVRWAVLPLSSREVAEEAFASEHELVLLRRIHAPVRGLWSSVRAQKRLATLKVERALAVRAMRVVTGSSRGRLMTDKQLKARAEFAFRGALSRILHASVRNWSQVALLFGAVLVWHYVVDAEVNELTPLRVMTSVGLLACATLAVVLTYVQYLLIKVLGLNNDGPRPAETAPLMRSELFRKESSISAQSASDAALSQRQIGYIVSLWNVSLILFCTGLAFATTLYIENDQVSLGYFLSSNVLFGLYFLIFHRLIPQRIVMLLFLHPECIHNDTHGDEEHED